MTVTVSDEPWTFSEGDYTLEQWDKACLIHNHDGPPKSKIQCKLPVREPDGDLNRNGMAAAAAALGGARSTLIAPDSEKASAKKELADLYKQIGADLPPSLQHSAVEGFLEHYGVKGMTKKPTRPLPLDRITRVANATKINQAKKVKKPEPTPVEHAAKKKKGSDVVQMLLTNHGEKPLSKAY